MKEKNKKYITLNSGQVNAGIVASYQKALLQFVNMMIKSYTKEILDLFRENKTELKQIRYATDADISEEANKRLEALNKAYNTYLTNKAPEMSAQMVQKTAQNNRKSFIKEYIKFMALALQYSQPGDKVFNDFFKNQFAPINFQPTEEGKKAFLETFSLNVKPYSEIAEQIKRATVANNAELIKSIHQQYHREVSQAVYESVINGQPAKIIKCFT